MFKFVNKKNRTVAAFLLVCCITVSMLYSTPAYALEVTQTDVKMYTTSGTPVYAAPDLNSTIVVYLERFVNVTVTGITDNGFYRVNLNGDYYIPGRI
ncbi:MAG: SH3 domain-containing protein [Lachnospiraceae bacterium]